MKRADFLRAKLKAARSELRHKQRQYNSAEKSMARTIKTILELERKLDAYVATP
jgi:hypothetical protein|tara:strand:+ start:519 stop:680 length:162 start_codon:yes stop_codon:yes gene_type:complete